MIAFKGDSWDSGNVWWDFDEKTAIKLHVCMVNKKNISLA